MAAERSAPRRALLIVAISLASCTGTNSAAPPSSRVVATPTSITLASPPTSTPSAATTACSDAGATSAQVVDRYFQLSTSGNVVAITDCFALSWRTRPSFPDGAQRWSTAGPPSDIVIRPLDRANGCDRLSVSAHLANASAVNWGGSAFFTVGPESGRTRIYEITTALVAADQATTTCR